MKGIRRKGRQRKRWEDIKDWTGLEFGKSVRAVEDRVGEGALQGRHLWWPHEHQG